MPNVIFKKTFKMKPSGFKVAHEKTFSFHGTAVSQGLIAAVNQALAAMHLTGKAQPLQFRRNSNGHYAAEMNHDYQKYHEEDAIVAVLDVMEVMGWTFKFQYDTEVQSEKLGGSSMTSRELFMFHKPV
jgi:hypothetical protein